MTTEHLVEMKPARLLLGWMPPEDAVASLAGQRQRELDNPAHKERAAKARAAVAERRPAFGVEDVVLDDAGELAPRQQKLAEDPGLAQIFTGGTRLGLIDLRRVCALQAGVLIDKTVPDLDPNDLDALLAFTVRPPSRPRLEVQYDSGRKAWMILAPDMNLRLAGEFREELDDGGLALGFEIREFGSSVRAVRHQDRYVLIDGYHRAVGLLKRGINVVPALVDGEVPAAALFGGAAGLAPEVFLGNRPPLLPDFWDDDVSAEAGLPATTRLLVVEALDLRAWG